MTKPLQLLLNNINANHPNVVSAYNVAVSDSAGPIEFYYRADRPGSHVNSTLKKKGLSSSKTATAALLSAYLEDQEVDLLKLDIEGSETVALRELARTGRLKQVRETIVEYHHHVDSETDELSEALLVLEHNGFGYQLASYPSRPFQKRTAAYMLLYGYGK